MDRSALNFPTPAAFAPELYRLRAEVETLREENTQLRHELGAGDNLEFRAKCKAILGLRPAAAQLLHIVCKGKAQSQSALMLAYAGHKYESPAYPVIRVQMNIIRRALKPHGVEIHPVYGKGFRMTPENRLRVEELLGVTIG